MSTARAAQQSGLPCSRKVRLNQRATVGRDEAGRTAAVIELMAPSVHHHHGRPEDQQEGQHDLPWREVGGMREKPDAGQEEWFFTSSFLRQDGPHPAEDRPCRTKQAGWPS